MAKKLEKSPKKTFRFVSYNVHSGKNTKEIAEVFTHDKNLRAADVILFQEIEFHQAEKICRAETIARHLGFNFVYKPARKLKNEATHGLAILSRFPLKNAKSITLPRHRLFFKVQSRIALVAQVNIGGVKITVCNIHLDTRLNTHKRISQLDACVQKLRKNYGKNIVIGGDFNTIPFKSIIGGVPVFYSNQSKHVHKHMLKMGFKHCCQPKGYTMKKIFLAMKLDHIFTDKLPMVKCGVEKHIYASDHKPIWAEIEIN